MPHHRPRGAAIDGRRLRPDLEIGPTEGGAFVIKDPPRRAFYRVGPDEVAILRLCDGSRTDEQVRAAFEAGSDASLPPDVLAAFLRSAHARGWFAASGETGHGAGMALQARRGSILGRILFWRVKAFDPDPFLSRLHPRVAWMMTPGFLLFALALTAFAGWIFWTEREAAMRTAFGLATPSAVAVAWLATGLVLLIHETGHGIACKHWGGRVPEMGFLLLFFLPCAYTDVSDAWMFPQRMRRAMVTLAGPLIQAVMWALCVLVWRVTAPETAVHQIAYAVAAVNLVSLVLNFNPLIKLDGYYLLADLVGIPNLRQRAIGHIWGRFPARDMREAAIYWVYGVLALGWTILILGGLAWALGNALANGLGVIGWVLLGGLIVSMAAPGQTTTPTGRPRVKKRWVFLALLAGVIAYGALMPGELKVEGPMEIHATREVVIRAPFHGRLAELRVAEGTDVGADDVLAVMDTADLILRRGRAQAELDEARAELARLEAGPRPEEIDVAQRRVQAAEARTAFAETQMTRMRELFQQSAVSSVEVERAESSYTVALKEEEEAEAQLALLQAGPTTEELTAARHRVRALELGLESAADEVLRAEIRAPVAGRVLGDLTRLAPGRVVTQGEELFVIGSQGLEAWIEVSERDIGEVAPGAVVEIKVAAWPERTLEARVDVIGATAMEGATPGRSIIVRARLPDDPDLPLRPGMTGYGRVLCGRRQLLAIWTRKFVRGIRLEFW